MKSLLCGTESWIVLSLNLLFPQKCRHVDSRAGCTPGRTNRTNGFILLNSSDKLAPELTSSLLGNSLGKIPAINIDLSIL